MTPKDTPLTEILELVALQLGAARVGPDDHLLEDLGAESADLLNLVVALEDRYDIQIDESEIPELATAADVHELVRRRRAAGGS